MSFSPTFYGLLCCDIDFGWLWQIVYYCVAMYVKCTLYSSFYNLLWMINFPEMVPGRRKEQRDVSGNRIYNKYNIAELQVQIEFALCITAAVNFRARSDMSTGDGWWNPCLGSRWAGLSYFWYISLLFYASSTELYHFLESGKRTSILWIGFEKQRSTIFRCNSLNDFII